MSRARIHETPGKLKQLLGKDVNILPHLDPNNDFMHSAMVDETYQQVASHVDLGTQAKIIKGEYVDFAKLVPKDRVMTNDDTRFEMRIKDGHSTGCLQIMKVWLLTITQGGSRLSVYSLIST